MSVYPLSSLYRYTNGYEEKSSAKAMVWRFEDSLMGSAPRARNGHLDLPRCACADRPSDALRARNPTVATCYPHCFGTSRSAFWNAGNHYQRTYCFKWANSGPAASTALSNSLR